MSQALPMSRERRGGIYAAQTGRPRFTPRQNRQYHDQHELELLRKFGVLSHGATGERTRKPIARSLIARGLTS